jgi:hypothetical protein
MKKLLIASVMLAAACAPALARHDIDDTDAVENLYGTTIESFDAAPDRYAHSRSVEEYRRIVSPDDDAFGMCRHAEHLDQCLRAWRAYFEKFGGPEKKHQNTIDVFPMGRPNALLPPTGIPPAAHFVYVAGEQSRFYDSRGNSVGTATRDSQGTTTFRDNRGNITGKEYRR